MVYAYPGLAPLIQARRARFGAALLYNVVYKNRTIPSLYSFRLSYLYYLHAPTSIPLFLAYTNPSPPRCYLILGYTSLLPPFLPTNLPSNHSQILLLP